MKLVAKRNIRSVEQLVIGLLDANMKVGMCLTADSGGGKRRKLTSERGITGARKVHFVDFGGDNVGILEWDKAAGSDTHEVRLYVEERVAEDDAVKRTVAVIFGHPDHSGPVSPEDRGRLMELDAMAWFSAGRHDKAKIVAERIVKLNPRLPRAWNCIGACYSALNENHQAIHYYLKALQADRSIFRVWVNLGNRYNAVGDELRSIVAYRLSLSRPDRYRQDDELRRDVIRKLGNKRRMDLYNRHLRRTRDKEINMLAKGTANRKSRERVEYGTGLALLRAGEYEKAAEEISKALKLAPEDPVIYNDIAHCRFHAGKLDEALKTIDTALSIDGGISLLHVTKAEILMKLSRHREALDCYRKAIDLDGAHAAAYYSKALAEDHLGMREAAEKSFQHFIVVSNEAHESQVNYARGRLQEFEYWRRRKPS